MKHVTLSLLLLVFGFGFSGCVERYISITSEPSGAIVWLNDEEVGATPIRIAFTWYGDYEVVLRKDGYETLKTSHKADAPVYQWVGLDFVSECLLPITFVDEHVWEFSLDQKVQPSSEELVLRAQSLRTEAMEDID